MLKIVGVGIWVILVTAAATFASVYVSAGGDDGTAEKADAGFEELTSEMTSIPVMRNGDVAGYVILQLSFAADRAILEQKKLDPMPFMKDAAFRIIFTRADIDFSHVKKEGLDRLTSDIALEANARLGTELIRHVLLQQFNFVKKEDIRTNWIGGGGGEN